MSEPFISIIVPAYNESKRIVPTLESIQKYFADKSYDYEIIAVNDGSPDNTFEVLTKCQSRIRNLKIINNPVNEGKGYAVKCGMLTASGKYRLFMDADNSVKIDTIDPFMSEIEAGNDVVIGSIALKAARVKEANGWHRRVFGSMSKWLIRTLATPKIYDTQRGFKLFTARAANIIFPLQTINRFGFDIELLVIALKNNLSIKEVPVEFNNPEGSTVKLSDYLRTFTELSRIVSNKVQGRYDITRFSAEQIIALSQKSLNLVELRQV
jgi:glycosyltransferase involved in cell wall biosynthesis